MRSPTALGLAVALLFGSCASALAQQGTEAQEGAKSEPIPDSADDEGATRQATKTTPDEEIAFRVRHAVHQEREFLLLRKDWDKYFRYMKKVYKPRNRIHFTRRLLEEFCNLYAMKLHYYDNVPALEEEGRKVMRKLERGAPWKRLVKLHCDDVLAAKEEGKLGRIGRLGFRYPIEMALYEIEVGGYGGPYWTEWGLEIFRVEGFGGEVDSMNQWVQASYILMVYQGESKVPKPKKEFVLRNVRLSSPHPEFTKLISPGRMDHWPETYGATDLAPLGDPDKILTSPIGGYYLPEEIEAQKLKKSKLEREQAGDGDEPQH